MASHSLEHRIAALEAIEAIRRVVGTYAHGADRRNDPAIMSGLFHDDGVWEAEGFGRREGRDEIVAHLAAIAAREITWSLHYMVSPVVELDEDLRQASCHWYLWELAQVASPGQAPRPHWMAGWYRSRLRRQGDAWRFSHVRLELQLVHASAEAWVPMRQSSH